MDNLRKEGVFMPLSEIPAGSEITKDGNLYLALGDATGGRYQADRYGNDISKFYTVYEIEDKATGEMKQIKVDAAQKMEFVVLSLPKTPFKRPTKIIRGPGAR